jgi:hypothetical protein
VGEVGLYIQALDPVARRLGRGTVVVMPALWQARISRPLKQLLSAITLILARPSAA